MMRRAAPALAGLLAGAAIAGALAGLRFTPPDPAEAVSRAASAYRADTGGRAEDCAGVAEKGAIRVTCEGAERRVYVVDRWGLRPARLREQST